MTGFSGEAFWSITFIYVFSVLTYYGFPALYARKSGTYMDHLETQSAREDRTITKHTLHGAISNRISPAMYNVILFSVVILPLTYNLGQTVAKFQSTFLVSTKSPRFAQILKSGDLIILRELSGDGTRFGSHIRILDPEKLSEEVFMSVTLIRPVVPPALDQHGFKDMNSPAFAK